MARNFRVFVNNATLDNVRNLVTTLRTGGFSQTYRYLKCGTCFCIGGVMLELYRQATGNGRWETYYDEEYFVLLDNNGHEMRYTQSLPFEVLRWYGIKPVEAGNLMRANDKGAMFSDLADKLCGMFKVSI